MDDFTLETNFIFVHFVNTSNLSNTLTVKKFYEFDEELFYYLDK